MPKNEIVEDFEKKISSMQEKINQEANKKKPSIAGIGSMLSSVCSFSMPSGFGSALALDGDKIMGVDNHNVYLIVNGAPVSIGVLPIPFIGTIEVDKNENIKKKSKKLAYDGMEVKGEIFAHKGPILAGVPLIVAETVGPRIMPTITLHQTHDKEVLISNTKVLTVGNSKVTGCKTSTYNIIPSQFSLTLK